MRSRSVVTTLLTLTAGVAVSAVARRLAARRRAQISLVRTAAATPAVVAPAPAPADVPAVAVVPAEPAADRQGVVLPFTRPAPVAPAQKATPARCGENGGRTKAGAPCAARATSGGRCHHHRAAA
jgi:hypothetical protein